ncbi:MAG: putative membrane protein [Myxococcota bacterium]|jgi:uncharacterized membrane protein
MPISNTPIIHLYRGELGRLTIYRVRLDTTTNWALGASVAVITFTLGTPNAPAEVLLLPYVLAIVFAYIEGRRYLDMEASRVRVCALESGFFAPLLRNEPIKEDFLAEMAARLVDLGPEMTLRQAVANRVRRNYIWIVLTLYAAWWLKLWLGVDGAIAQAGHGAVPGWWVLVLSPVMVLPWMGIAMLADHRPPGH